MNTDLLSRSPRAICSCTTLRLQRSKTPFNGQQPDHFARLPPFTGLALPVRLRRKGAGGPFCCRSLLLWKTCRSGHFPAVHERYDICDSTVVNLLQVITILVLWKFAPLKRCLTRHVVAERLCVAQPCARRRLLRAWLETSCAVVGFRGKPESFHLHLLWIDQSIPLTSGRNLKVHALSKRPWSRKRYLRLEYPDDSASWARRTCASP